MNRRHVQAQTARGDLSDRMATHHHDNLQATAFCAGAAVMQKHPTADCPVLKPVHPADGDLRRKAEYLPRAASTLGRLETPQVISRWADLHNVRLAVKIAGRHDGGEPNPRVRMPRRNDIGPFSIADDRKLEYVVDEQFEDNGNIRGSLGIGPATDFTLVDGIEAP